MDENFRFISLLDEFKAQGLISSYAAVAEQLGTNKAAISDIKGGRKKLSLDLLRSLKLSYPQVNLNWVIMGEGEMMTKSTETINIKVMGSNEPQPDLYKTTQFHSDDKMSEVISVLSAQIVAKDETIRKLREELEVTRAASGNHGQCGGENAFNQVLPVSGDSDARYAGMVSDDHHWEEAVTIAAEP